MADSSATRHLHALNGSAYVVSRSCSRYAENYVLFMNTVRTVICPHCNQPMELVRTIPAIDLPELLVFYCQSCGHVDTQEDQAGTSTAPAHIEQRPFRVYPIRMDWGALS